MLPENVGIIKTIETFANMAIVLGSGGVIFAILKVIPETKNKELRKHILAFSVKAVFIFSFFIFIAFNVAALLGLIATDEKLVSWFHIYSVLFIPSVVIQLLIRYYQAVDLFKRISTIIFYLKLISAVIVLAATYWFYIEGYVASMVITTVLVMLALLWDLRKDLKNNPFLQDFSAVKKQIIKLSKAAFTAQIIDQFKLHSGFLIANYVLLDRVSFGEYAFALIIIQGLNIMTSTVQQFLIPKMSEISGSIALFFERLKRFEKRYALFGIAIFVLAQLTFPFIIRFAFRESYEPSILLIQIMLVGWLIETFYALKGVIFLSLGKMKYISYASLIIFLVSVPIMYFLNDTYGSQGAAWSYVIQNCISLITLLYFTHRVKKKLTTQ